MLKKIIGYSMLSSIFVGIALFGSIQSKCWWLGPVVILTAFGILGFVWLAVSLIAKDN